ncbi:FAST kinase domain-containing protein 5, mitochondrial-like [Tubulanus polymorphus]|uniref:FAST kinase domain-containing protein 5, mitochondrial-like n=1 Tax=Tubulanus polymorphus TaxID=672921 RepID=UPI003DA60381
MMFNLVKRGCGLSLSRMKLITNSCFPSKRIDISCQPYIASARHLSVSMVNAVSKFDLKLNPMGKSGTSPPQEFENEHGHRILETLPHYKHLVSPVADNSNQRLKISNKIAETLRDYETRQNDNFSAPEKTLKVLDEIVSLNRDNAIFEYKPFVIFCESLCDELKTFNEVQLLECIELLSKLSLRECTEGPMRMIRFVLGKSIVVEIEKYALNWDKTTIFSVLEFFYQFRYKHIPRQLFQQLELYVDNMTKEDVVYFLYYINLARYARLRLRQMLERKLEEFVDDLSVDELAVACLGLYKSKHVITSNKIVEVCLSKLCQNTAHIDEITISAILKSVYGATNRNVEPFSAQVKSYSLGLLTALLPRMRDFKITTCLHLLQISLTMKQLNHGILQALCDKVTNEDISTWRLKDLSWLLLQLGLFQSKLAEKDLFYRKFVDEFLRPGRQAEGAYTRFPQCAVRALVGFSYLEIFPREFINQVFSPSFIKLIKEMTSYDITRDLFQLDQTIRLEYPDYDGNLLPEDMLVQIQDHANINSLKLPHEKLLSQQTRRDKLLLDVQSQLELLFNGNMYGDIMYTLPHIQTADVVFEVKDGSLVDLIDWRETSSPKPGNKRIVILIAAPNNYHIYQTDYGFSRKLLGNYILKRRQIQKLGYTVLEIPYYEWNQARAGKPAYLKKLLSPHINFM